MYVQYQIPMGKLKPPVVLVHGGCGTGRVWESTPDGREGYQSIFLRRGPSVYIFDFSRRGRAGQPAFNWPLCKFDGNPHVTNVTGQQRMQRGWSRSLLWPV